MKIASIQTHSFGLMEMINNGIGENPNCEVYLTDAITELSTDNSSNNKPRTYRHSIINTWMTRKLHINN